MAQGLVGGVSPEAEEALNGLTEEVSKLSEEASKLSEEASAGAEQAVRIAPFSASPNATNKVASRASAARASNNAPFYEAFRGGAFIELSTEDLREALKVLLNGALDDSFNSLSTKILRDMYRARYDTSLNQVPIESLKGATRSVINEVLSELSDKKLREVLKDLRSVPNELFSKVIVKIINSGYRPRTPLNPVANNEPPRRVPTVMNLWGGGIKASLFLGAFAAVSAAYILLFS